MRPSRAPSLPHPLGSGGHVRVFVDVQEFAHAKGTGQPYIVRYAATSLTVPAA
jgi:hypothetical protein